MLLSQKPLCHCPSSTLLRLRTTHFSMDQFAIKAGRKVFERNLKQYEPADPLYETYTDKKGRQRRRKVHIPDSVARTRC